MTDQVRSRYQIQDSRHYFRAGSYADGRQVLLGPMGEELVAVMFGADGTLLGVEREHRPQLVPGDLATVMRRWLRRSHVTPGPIAVQPFRLADLPVGIEDLPRHYQMFLDDPGAYPGERQEQLSHDIEDWRTHGYFVLWWADDYYLDLPGEVVSS